MMDERKYETGTCNSRADLVFTAGLIILSCLAAVVTWYLA